MATPSAERPIAPTVIIDNIDLDAYDDEVHALRLEVMTLCRRLPFDGETLRRSPKFSQHQLLRKLELEYFGRFREERVWDAVLIAYSSLSRHFTELKYDTEYQLSAVRLLALYINHKCEMFRFQAQKYRDEVNDCCVQLWTLMNVILCDSVELKTMVLLHTKMTPANAFLLIILCNRVHTCAMKRIFEPVACHRMSLVILVNASVLLLNRWYQLMPTVQRRTFHEDMATFVQRLSKLRSHFRHLRPWPHRLFYARFIRDFETSTLRDLYTNPVTNAAIEKFVVAYKIYWKGVNKNPDASRRQRPRVLPSPPQPTDSDVIHIIDDDDDDDDNNAEEDNNTQTPAAPAMPETHQTPSSSPPRRRSSSSSSISPSISMPQVSHEIHRSEIRVVHLSDLLAQPQDPSNVIETDTTQSAQAPVAESRSSPPPPQHSVCLDTDSTVKSLQNTRIESVSPCPRISPVCLEKVNVAESLPSAIESEETETAEIVLPQDQVCSKDVSVEKSAQDFVVSVNENTVQKVVSEPSSTSPEQSQICLDKSISVESLLSTIETEKVDTSPVVLLETASLVSPRNQVCLEKDVDTDTAQMVVLEPALPLSAQDQNCLGEDSTVEAMQSSVVAETNQTVVSEPILPISPQDQVCLSEDSTVESMQSPVEAETAQVVISEPVSPMTPQDQVCLGEDSTVESMQSSVEAETTQAVISEPVSPVTPQDQVGLGEDSNVESMQSPVEAETAQVVISELISEPVSPMTPQDQVCLGEDSNVESMQSSVEAETTQAVISEPVSPMTPQDQVCLEEDSTDESMQSSVVPETTQTVISKLVSPVTPQDQVGLGADSNVESMQSPVDAETTQVVISEPVSPMTPQDQVGLDEDCTVESMQSSVVAETTQAVISEPVLPMTPQDQVGLGEDSTVESMQSSVGAGSTQAVISELKTTMSSHEQMCVEEESVHVVVSEPASPLMSQDKMSLDITVEKMQSVVETENAIASEPTSPLSSHTPLCNSADRSTDEAIETVIEETAKDLREAIETDTTKTVTPSLVLEPPSTLKSVVVAEPISESSTQNQEFLKKSEVSALESSLQTIELYTTNEVTPGVLSDPTFPPQQTVALETVNTVKVAIERETAQISVSDLASPQKDAILDTETAKTVVFPKNLISSSITKIHSNAVASKSDVQVAIEIETAQISVFDLTSPHKDVGLKTDNALKSFDAEAKTARSVASKSDVNQFEFTPKTDSPTDESSLSASNVPKSTSQAIHIRPSVIANNSSKTVCKVNKMPTQTQTTKTSSNLEQTAPVQFTLPPMAAICETVTMSAAKMISSPIAPMCSDAKTTVNAIVLDTPIQSKEELIVAPDSKLKVRVSKVKKTNRRLSTASTSRQVAFPPTITSVPTPVKIQKAVYSMAGASLAKITDKLAATAAAKIADKANQRTPNVCASNASVIASSRLPEAPPAAFKSLKANFNPTPVKLTRAIGYSSADELTMKILPSPSPVQSADSPPLKSRKTVRFDDRPQDCMPASVQNPLPSSSLMQRKSSLKTSVIIQDPAAEIVNTTADVNVFHLRSLVQPKLRVQPDKKARKVIRNPVVRLKKLPCLSSRQSAHNPVACIPSASPLPVHECANTSVITKDTSSRSAMTQTRSTHTVDIAADANVAQQPDQPNATLNASPTNTINTSSPAISNLPPTQFSETIRIASQTPQACIRTVSTESPEISIPAASIPDVLPAIYSPPLSTTQSPQKDTGSAETIERSHANPVEKPFAPSAPVQNIEISSSTHGDTHHSPEGTPNASTSSNTPTRTEPDSSGAPQIDASYSMTGSDGSPAHDEPAKESNNGKRIDPEDTESVTSEENGSSDGSGTPLTHTTDTQQSDDSVARVSEPKQSNVVAVDSDNSTSDDNCSKSSGSASVDMCDKILPSTMDSESKTTAVVVDVDSDQHMADETRSNCAGTPLNDEDGDNLMANPVDMPIPVYGLFGGVDVSNDHSDNPAPTKKARFGQSAATVRMTVDTINTDNAPSAVALTPAAKSKPKDPASKRPNEPPLMRPIAAQTTAKNIQQLKGKSTDSVVVSKQSSDSNPAEEDNTSSAPKTVSDVDISDENLIQIQKDWFRYVNLLNTHSSPLTNCTLKPPQPLPISTDVCEQILGKPPQHALTLPSGSSSLGQIFGGSLSEDELQLQSLKPIKVESLDRRPQTYTSAKVERKHKLADAHHSAAPPVKRSKPPTSEWSKEIALFDRHFGMLPASDARPNRIATILNENVPKTAASETVHALLLAQMYFIQCAVDPFRRFEPKKVHFVDETVKRSESTFVALQTANDVENQYKRLKKSYLNRRASLPDRDSEHFNKIIDNADSFLKQWTNIRHTIFKQKPSEPTVAGPSTSQPLFDCVPPSAVPFSVDSETDSAVTAASSAVTHFPVDGEICSKLQLDDCYNLFEYNDFMQESGSSTIQHVNGDRLQSLVESQQADDVLLGNMHTRKQDGMISGLGFEYTESKPIYEANPVQAPLHMQQQQQQTVPISMPVVHQPRPQPVAQMVVHQPRPPMPVVRQPLPQMSTLRQTVTMTVQPIVPMQQQQLGMMSAQRCVPMVHHQSAMTVQMLMPMQQVESMSQTVSGPASVQRTQAGSSRDTGTAQRVLPIQRSAQVRKPETWDCFKRLPRSKVPTVKTAK